MALWRSRKPGGYLLESTQHDLELQKLELRAQLDQALRQGNGVLWIMIFVGLAVMLLSLPTIIGLGLPTILGDYRLVFLAGFSILSGLGLLAYAVYYRRSYTASAVATYELGIKRIDNELLALTELYHNALHDEWVVQDRLRREDEGDISDDPQR